MYQLFGIISFLLVTSSVSFGADSLEKVKKEHTTFIIIRHGESDHNISHRYNSQPDHPLYFVSNLTEEGRNQVQRTAERLSQSGLTVSNVYRSPLPRTIQTSEILNRCFLLTADHVFDDALIIESGAGDLEGKETSRIREERTIEYINKHHSGESREAMRSRLCNFIKKIALSHPNEVTAIVTHGFPSDVLMEILQVPNKKNLETAGSVVVKYTGILEGCEVLR